MERLVDFARLLIAWERRVRVSLGTLLSFETRQSGPSEGAELSGGAESYTFLSRSWAPGVGCQGRVCEVELSG